MANSEDLMSRLPIFIFPAKLNFYIDDVASHKQLITIYNPYEFTLRYKLYSNVVADDKYRIVEPEGVIRSKCVLDIIVRHLQAYPQNDRRTDRFRIKIFRASDKTFIAQRDVQSTLYNSLKDSPPEYGEERFQQVPPTQTNTPAHRTVAREEPNEPRGPDPLILLIAVVCLTLLAMPYPWESSAYLPEYMRVSMNCKLIAAGGLGMVIVNIFKT